MVLAISTTCVSNSSSRPAGLNPLPRQRRGRLVTHAAHPDGPQQPDQPTCPFASLLDPPVTKRSLLQQLNLSADTFETQRSILAGSPAARAPYMFVDTVLVGSADLAREVLGDEGGMFDVDFPPHMLDILGRRSMGTVNEPQHMQMRKLFAPGFTAAEVGRYLPRVQQIAQRFCANWAAAGAVPAWHEELKLFTFEVICAVVAGIDWDEAELREMSGLFAKVTAALGFPITLPLPFSPYTQGLAARQQIIRRLQPQIDKYRAELEVAGVDTGGQRPCILQRWVAARDELGQGLTDEQLQDNLLGLLVAGHDTTSSTLSIVLAYLDRFPEVQARVRAEQQRLQADFGQEITPAVLASMPYTEAVVREVWRLHPVVPIVGRRVAAAAASSAAAGSGANSSGSSSGSSSSSSSAGVVKLGPYKLSPGQATWIGLNHIIKTDPRWQGATGDAHPSSFYPDRFLTPEGQQQGAQLVFGAGSRSCLGERLAWADIKVLLATMMRGYEFKLAGPANIAGFPFPVARLDCNRFSTAPLP